MVRRRNRAPWPKRARGSNEWKKTRGWIPWDERDGGGGGASGNDEGGRGSHPIFLCPC